MPLYSNAERVIRTNLHEASQGRKPKPVTIGCLSDEQLITLNEARRKSGLTDLDGSVFFRGTHIHESRIVRDGYTVDDVLAQIMSSFNDRSVVRFTPKMTALQCLSAREDGYGNLVRDECVLECTSRYPRAELFSVIPKGDRVKPIHALK